MTPPDPTDASPAANAVAAAQDEVVQLCSELIRIESVNTGDPATIGDGEARAARYIQDKLEEVGYETTYLEAAPGRGNVICRLAGADPDRGALLVHGHVDVVPADASEWTVRPVLRRRPGRLCLGPRRRRHEGHGRDDRRRRPPVLKTHGFVPPRDLVFSFMSDEEAGGAFGRAVAGRPSPRAVRRGHRGDLRGRRLLHPARRRAPRLPGRRGREGRRLGDSDGHRPRRPRFDGQPTTTRSAGSPRRSPASASHEFPITRTATVDALLASITELTGLEFPEERPGGLGRQDRPVSRIVNATLRNTANPTMLKAGYKANVIPSTAQATVDCRVLPGSRGALPGGGRADRRRRHRDRVGLAAAAGVPVRGRPGRRDDGGAARPRTRTGRPSRTCCPAAPTTRPSPGWASPATASRRCGCPPTWTSRALFHGVDERVPVDALTFGARVLDRLLRTC